MIPARSLLAANPLEIEYELIACATRHAWRKHRISRTFAFAEIRIAVIDSAGYHARDACSADALLAGREDFDARFGRRFHDRLPGLHYEGHVAPGADHPEFPPRFSQWGGGEELVMNVVELPSTGLGDTSNGLDHRLWPACVDMAVGLRKLQALGDFPARLVRIGTKYAMDPVAQLTHPLWKCQMLFRSTEAVEVKVPISRSQGTRHRQDRCNSDTSGNEH